VAGAAGAVTLEGRLLRAFVPAELYTYVPPAPVEGFCVGCGTAVGGVVPPPLDFVALGFGTGVLVAFGTGVAVAAGTVGVGGMGVAVGTGVTVGVGDGGPGGPGMGDGTNVGGGGGVLAAANVCSDALWNGLLTMISPAVSGTATSRDKRLFIQDSLRVGFAFGSPVCRKMISAAQSLSLRDSLTIACLTRR